MYALSCPHIYEPQTEEAFNNLYSFQYYNSVEDTWRCLFRAIYQIHVNTFTRKKNQSWCCRYFNKNVVDIFVRVTCSESTAQSFRLQMLLLPKCHSLCICAPDCLSCLLVLTDLQWFALSWLPLNNNHNIIKEWIDIEEENLTYWKFQNAHDSVVLKKRKKRKYNTVHQPALESSHLTCKTVTVQ